MQLHWRKLFPRADAPSPWLSKAPIREELFGPERLDQHAESLAVAQTVTPRPAAVLPLIRRVQDNGAVLLAAYNASLAAAKTAQGVTPATEWLLDNYRLVAGQIAEITNGLPPGYYRQLPKLDSGPFAGYPRVFGLVWAYVAHTDSHVDPDALIRFLRAYQRVQPLTIGELWAVAATLRIVLIENLRRLAMQIAEARALRATANEMADRLFGTLEREAEPLAGVMGALPAGPLDEILVAQLARRLRDQDPQVVPARDWLEDRLRLQGSSLELAVYNSHQRQGASNVTVRNIITSLRLMAETDWVKIFEAVSLVDARLAAGSGFVAMDFPTRNLYRTAIENLARRSDRSEIAIAEAAITLCKTPPGQADPARAREPGFYLLAGGRAALEQAIGYRPPLKLRLGRLTSWLGIHGYVGGIMLLAALLLAIPLALLAGHSAALWLALLALLGLAPALDAATALVNRVVSMTFGAAPLPGLELLDGIPPNLRTLVAIPTLLTGEADLLEQIERLEVHHLANPGDELFFALLTDGLDADSEATPGEEALLARGAEALARLNLLYSPRDGGERFLLLHRRRLFNPGEGRWMGWERKRGKLHELNRLLRGATDTSFVAVAGQAPAVPAGVRYVITLDSDTRLPRDAARRLIGKMAHPLNRPRFDALAQRVVDGYAILQPRVTPALPIGREGSLHQRIFSSPGGIDPYAAAVSDTYQDLFGEGSFTGKGIYDVDAFEAAMAGRVPENALLSHDLFEGTFARAGLATDVEVIEEFPTRYDVAAKRLHRWVRGDWQLLPWLLGRRRRERGGVPALGLGKMLDNLRRSLVPPMALAALLAGWLLPLPAALLWTGFIVATLAIPAFIPIPFALLPPRSGVTAASHLSALGADLRRTLGQVALGLALLPDQAWRMGDAILRTLVRLAVTRKHLLEWVAAAQVGLGRRLDLPSFARQMAGGLLLGLGGAAIVLALAPTHWPLVLPFALAWLAAPALALWISRSAPFIAPPVHSAAEGQALRLTARRTWRFFEVFVTAKDHHLPPDNFQETPSPVLARRTSPTNIGLYLLATVSARDFGWAGTLETLERIEATLAAMQRLPRHRGHFFNWYDTQDLRVLDPPYVSAVDSGNLAGHLLTLANACAEWIESPVPGAELWQGFDDGLRLAQESLTAQAGATALAALLERIGTAATSEAGRAELPTVVAEAEQLATTVEDGDDLRFWLSRLSRHLAEQERDRLQLADAPRSLARRLRLAASKARSLALVMDFEFLVEPRRKLLSIGYSTATDSRDVNCYDLLASEARLASLFAIAKGDVPTRHWFRLGRTVTPVGSGAALVSWSGSMFEYLMPSLVMRAPVGSLLEQTSRLVVAQQQAYARAQDVPWGMSESAYNARDREFTYQYGNFGVPGLGLKRGLGENLVVAPYATALAAMVDAPAAVKNLERLAALGGRGRYGFYEALDFTESRVPEGARLSVVRAYMAHHQGMSIVAIANTLQDGRMRARFHREPMIQASELLLQERVPRDVAALPARPDEVALRPPSAAAEAPAVRRLQRPVESPPATHLLSNGRYGVMLTSAGSGYSRWRDLAVTRWREDATRDAWGSYIFLKDTRDGAVWSAGWQPAGATPDSYDVTFSEGRAEFVRRDGALETQLEVLVSGEDDAEVRRLTLSNHGLRRREIEVTSYAELVLAPAAADSAHAAFSKLFVVTEHLPALGAILATRRRRSPGETEVWAAHFAVVEGVAAAPPEFETDRARFIGRGRTLAAPAALEGDARLSGTVGTVLDPVFALRQSLVIAPGKLARIAFWTVVAPTRASLLDLIDKHQDRHAFDRAGVFAWTQAQVELRHLGVSANEAAAFQRLAGHLVHAERSLRARSEIIQQGAGAQSGLWPHGISGDLPIVLLRIDDADDLEQVRQALRAHEFWRTKQLAVDLVILNERSASYLQDLQIAIESAVRSAQSRPRFGELSARGSVYALRSDLVAPDGRALLLSVARVVLSARRGDIAQQLARLPATPAPMPALRPKASRAVVAQPPRPPWTLEFPNGLGGFAKDGREYVTVLGPGEATPAPWINVVANPRFGFQVSADGSGYCWAGNARENQITPWSNDPVSDPPGETLYVRDLESGALWNATALPCRDVGHFVARHGRGYSRFEHTLHEIALDLLVFVPLQDPLKISRLTLRNLSQRPRRLSVTSYAEWVLGPTRAGAAPFVITERDTESGALFARNPWNAPFRQQVGFTDLGGKQSAWTADRTEFLGRNGSPGEPAALQGEAALGERAGGGLDPCAALQTTIELQPGEVMELTALLGAADSANEARALVQRYRAADLNAVFAAVQQHWDQLLGSVQVKTPDRALDVMLNGWLLYQSLACRIWARAGFYQASGAYGFRDQLQDGMALTFARPDLTRPHLLRAASRQFLEGDVQHWWLPATGQGIRTRISDDCAWLAFCVAAYIDTSGDVAVLDESVPFLEGPPLKPGEHDAFYVPEVSAETASLFEHCARALDRSVALTGAEGLPLIGTGDWNDGMNRVGEQGRGQSVWLGWLLITAIKRFAPLAETRDPTRAAAWRAHAEAVRQAIEATAWDGAWYRRGSFDDGTPLGSAANDECQIDAIAQSWSVLSGAGDPDRARTAMASMAERLIRWQDGVALLFTPPFDRTPKDPGYIKGYPPGLRENGGQYTHAALWSVMAYAKLGMGDEAAALFALLNPINHARTPAEAQRYKVEPYVIAADVYSVAPHVGRGGWTWYTGSAAWMYRAGMESIIGLKREGQTLTFDPCIPRGWPGFTVTVTLEATRYEIAVANPRSVNRGVAAAKLDGMPLTIDGGLRVPLDGRPHRLEVTLGAAP